MTDLATQIDQAGPKQQREMLEAAWLHIHHSGYPSEGPHDNCPKCDAFAALLDIGTDEAFTGAALMLVPEGWCIGINQQDYGWAVNLQKGYRTSYTDVILTRGGGVLGWPATPALAIAAACVRAHDAKEDV